MILFQKTKIWSKGGGYYIILGRVFKGGFGIKFIGRWVEKIYIFLEEWVFRRNFWARESRGKRGFWDSEREYIGKIGSSE